MRWPRQLMSLLFVLTLLAGPPVVLQFLIGPPLRGWPTVEQVRACVQQPLTEQTLTAALTIGAWLLWLMIAYTITVRLLVRLRATSAWLRRLPLPTPLQATASGIAGAAVFGVTTNAVAATPPQPPPPVAAGPTEDPGEISQDHGGKATTEDGYAVPGGWLPREVAEQVAAAAALVWLRRRRDYRPRRPGPTNPDDTDLAPLPPTVTAVQATLADSPTPAAAPLTADSLTALVGALPARSLGLAGPGALPIGRGLLLTILLARHRHPTAPLITTRTTLTNLLGPDAKPLSQRLPHLTIVDTIDEATQLVDTAGQPTMVLLVDDDCRGHDATPLANATAATGGTVIAIGGWPAGPTWQADSTGHLYDPNRPQRSGPRMCVLDQMAAIDLLSVIAQPGSTPTTPAAPGPLLPQTTPPGPRLPRQESRGIPRRRPTGVDRRLHLRVLGEPALLIDDEPLTIRRSAALQILVYLATHPTGADARQLTEAIWPGLPHHSLTGRLYTTLSDLRSSIRTASGLHVIDHNDDRYRLNPAHVDVDMWHLHAALQQAAIITTTTADAQAVIDAYPADIAAGRAWPWLDPIREATRRRVIDACVTLADTEPDPHGTLTVLQAGLRIDPYNADISSRASIATTALGDHDSAIKLHDDYLQALADAGLDGGPDRRPTNGTRAGQR
ncbi:hypothetical protein V6V47_30200 [Micromonospora sp. CPCC 205539]|uniref:hypothetical protein n=1 Tax=Micromonospora sp. CPCC 205539 TaxID=3122408 RepID=UPI002FEED55A